MAQTLPFAVMEVWLSQWRATERTRKKMQFPAELPGYFQTLEYGCWRAESLTPGSGRSANVAIVNEAFARSSQQAPIPSDGDSELGHGARRRQLTRLSAWFEIRSIQTCAKSLPRSLIPRPRKTRMGPGGQILIRSRLHESEIVAQVRRVLNEINPSITVISELPIDCRTTTLRERLMATLSSFFGCWVAADASDCMASSPTAWPAGQTRLAFAWRCGRGEAGVFWLICASAVVDHAGVAVGLR